MKRVVKSIYKCLAVTLLATLMPMISSCGHKQDIERVEEAASLINTDVNKARTLLQGIFAADVMPDSVKAKYYYIKALANNRMNRSPVGDSLLHFSTQYYLAHGDTARALHCEVLDCSRMFWVGLGAKAFEKFDSLVALQALSPDLYLEVLKSRMRLSCDMYDADRMTQDARLLLAVDTVGAARANYKILIATAHLYKREPQQAIALLDSIYAERKDVAKDTYQVYTLINIGGLYAEAGDSKKAIDILVPIEQNDLDMVDVYSKVLMHSFLAQAYYNGKQIDLAEKENAIAEALVNDPKYDFHVTHAGTVLLTKILIEAARTGKLRTGDFEKLTNQREEVIRRLLDSREEAEKSALLLHGQALQLRIKMQRQMLIGSIAVCALLAACVVYLVILLRRLDKSRKALAASNEEIKRQKERVEASERMKSEFIQSMTHEIRTPMNVIRGFADLLSHDQSLSDRNHMYASKMIDGVDTLSHIIDNLLDMSTLISMTEDDMQKDAVDITDLCMETIDEMDIYNKNGLEMKFVDAIEGSKLIETDAMYLQKILKELLSNALKFTPVGTVEVKCQRDGSHMKIYVSDTGIGVPPGKQEWVFGRYTKIDKFKHGIGIGLYICRVISSKLGANIYIDPKYARGCRVVVEI